MDIYALVTGKAVAIGDELVRLGRWSSSPPSEEAFARMGAFGEGTMTFEQWIQYVLLQRIGEIAIARGKFPPDSSVGVYAVRYFDGDEEAANLVQMLSELDALVNGDAEDEDQHFHATDEAQHVLGSISDLPVPEVLYKLGEVLPSFDGEQLEAQLQTFDAFMTPEESVKKAIAQILFSAAEKTTSTAVRFRIQKAAIAAQRGEQLAVPYKHDVAMQKYQEEFRKSYPEGETNA